MTRLGEHTIQRLEKNLGIVAWHVRAEIAWRDEKTRRRDPRRDTTRADHGSTRDSGGTVSAAGAAATKHDEARQEKTERGKVGAEMRREGRREIQQVRVRCLLD